MKKILEMQEKLNDDAFTRAYGQTFIKTFRSCPNEFTLDFTRAMIHEIFELKEEFQKTVPDEQNIGVELVDILHFLVSIYIGWSYELDKIVPSTIINEKVNQRIDNLLMSIIKLEDECQWKWWKYYDPNDKNYIYAIKASLIIINVNYWLLVETCGFTFQEIKDIYIQKNELNFARQRGGYGNEYQKTIDGEEDNKKIKVIKGGKEVK